jgi:hypothetical protein
MPKTPQIELSHESFQLLISRMGLSKKALSEALDCQSGQLLIGPGAMLSKYQSSTGRP